MDIVSYMGINLPSILHQIIVSVGATISTQDEACYKNSQTVSLYMGPRSEAGVNFSKLIAQGCLHLREGR